MPRVRVRAGLGYGLVVNQAAVFIACGFYRWHPLGLALGLGLGLGLDLALGLGLGTGTGLWLDR